MLSAVSFLQDTASELLYPLLPIYLTAVLGAPPAVVGVIEGAAEGAASLTKLASGPLGDRFARRPLIATGYGMAALGKVMVAAFAAWPGVLAGRMVDRLGKGLRGAPRDAQSGAHDRMGAGDAGAKTSAQRHQPEDSRPLHTH